MLLLAGLPPAAPALADSNGHAHPGLLFQIRAEPEPDTNFVYRAFLADPDDPTTLLVERSDTYLADHGQVDLGPAACPALGRAVAALATLPLPAVSIDGQRPYDTGGPHGTVYYFNGFLRFANGGEGEVSFTSLDLPRQPADPQLLWMRGLVQAFDTCRPRR
jgi:hypothetical protein